MFLFDLPQFDESMIVFDACKLIRDRVPDAAEGQRTSTYPPLSPSPPSLPPSTPFPLSLPPSPPSLPSPLFPHNYVFTITTQVIVLACTSVICVVRSSPVTIMMVWALCTHKTVLCGGGWSVTVAGSHVCVENDSVETIALSRPPDNGT